MVCPTLIFENLKPVEKSKNHFYIIRTSKGVAQKLSLPRPFVFEIQSVNIAASRRSTLAPIILPSDSYFSPKQLGMAQYTLAQVPKKSVWQRIGKFAQQRPKIKVIKKSYYVLKKGFSSVDHLGSGLLAN